MTDETTGIQKKESDTIETLRVKFAKLVLWGHRNEGTLIEINTISDIRDMFLKIKEKFEGLELVDYGSGLKKETMKGDRIVYESTSYGEALDFLSELMFSRIVRLCE